jgi:mannitol-1-phosphate/altronate dehydrogenase
VHIGVGNFHRAHRAVYFDDLANRAISHEWGITGVSLHHGWMKEVLAKQDRLYTDLMFVPTAEQRSRATELTRAGAHALSNSWSAIADFLLRGP